MKLTKPAIILLIILGILVYLALSYRHIYDFMGSAGLKSPYAVNNIFTVGNPSSFVHKKYVALGDSLSAGVGSDSAKTTLVYLYAVNLGDKNTSIDVVNIAWPGDETIDVLNNQVPETIKMKPDYVTLFIGINDIHEKRSTAEFKQNYQTILNELMSKTDAQITVINLPYLGANNLITFPFSTILDFRTKQFNAIIASLVQNNSRIRLIDLYSSSKKSLNTDNANYAKDLFHPSAQGYLLWAKTINEY